MNHGKICGDQRSVGDYDSIERQSKEDYIFSPSKHDSGQFNLNSSPATGPTDSKQRTSSLPKRIPHFKSERQKVLDQVKRS